MGECTKRGHLVDTGRLAQWLHTRVRQPGGRVRIGKGHNSRGACQSGSCAWNLLSRKNDEKTYNQLRFYTADGSYLGFHSKTLPTGSLGAEPVGEINHYAIRPLRTFSYRNQTIAGLICNDLWANPTCTPMPDSHLSDQLAKRGARIIFHAVNGGRSRGEWSDVNWNFHNSNLRMRARASNLWIVTVDSCEPIDIRCSAPSGVVDPQGNWRIKTCHTGIDRFYYDIDC